jgi:small-conductance mechanosensitive channel
MIIESKKLIDWILPLALISGGLLIGYIFDRILIHKLKSHAKRKKWRSGKIIAKGMNWMTLLWFSIAGLYGALINAPMELSFLPFIKKTLLIIVILTATIVLAKIAAGFVDSYAEKAKGILGASSIFKNLTVLVILLLGVLIILQSLGISITPVLTALGVGGLAVALALQDTLSNFFSGLQIIAAKQIRAGDYIELDSGEKGYVTDITWRNTTIRALPNNMIIVPNSKMASVIVINYNQPEKAMSVLVQVGVSYDSDLKKVEEITIDVSKKVLKEVQGGIPEFEPFIRYNTFDDFSINFTVILRAREFVNQYLIKHEFIKRLHERYEKEGIVIPFPIRTVYITDNKNSENKT